MPRFLSRQLESSGSGNSRGDRDTGYGDRKHGNGTMQQAEKTRAVGSKGERFATTPVGWEWALAWFFVNDRVKLAAYRILDHSRLAFLNRGGKE